MAGMPKRRRRRNRRNPDAPEDIHVFVDADGKAQLYIDGEWEGSFDEEFGQSGAEAAHSTAIEILRERFGLGKWEAYNHVEDYIEYEHEDDY